MKACNCSERALPVDSRGWMVSAYRVSVRTRLRASRASTVECVNCRARWRTSAKYGEILA